MKNFFHIYQNIKYIYIIFKIMEINGQEISYGGSDGFGGARLLKAQLKIVLPRVISGNWDSGGRRSSTFFNGGFWGQFEQLLIKSLSQIFVT